MKKLFYVPLEPYKERYTIQLSAPVTGWLESRWRERAINYFRVEGQSLNDQIVVGSVLDAAGRGFWACSQVMLLLKLLNDGEISTGDAIYFDDFWHPGISALPYAFHLTNVRPKMYAMLHAQSIDIFDFTYPMRGWMRPFEVGIGKILSGIFVTSTCLRDLCLYAGIGSQDTVHLCGLPYNSDEVKTHFPSHFPGREKQVIFTSRWDKEKCPRMFLSVVDEVLKVRDDIKFLVTTSAVKLRSNDLFLVESLRFYLDKYPNNLFLKEGLTKEEYYYELLKSKIQINTGDQDFVSWTLLEATTCGCRPLYPYFLSFPEALEYKSEFMYVKNDVKDAVSKILDFIDYEEEQDFSWVYKRFDESWERMLSVMAGVSYSPLY